LTSLELGIKVPGGGSRVGFGGASPPIAPCGSPKLDPGVIFGPSEHFPMAVTGYTICPCSRSSSTSSRPPGRPSAAAPRWPWRTWRCANSWSFSSAVALALALLSAGPTASSGWRCRAPGPVGAMPSSSSSPTPWASDATAGWRPTRAPAEASKRNPNRWHPDPRRPSSSLRFRRRSARISVGGRACLLSSDGVIAPYRGPRRGRSPHAGSSRATAALRSASCT
jgi:hypothetical protein